MINIQLRLGILSRTMSFDIAAQLDAALSLHRTSGQSEMKTIAEYRQFAAACREMAMRITDPKDKHAVELMAAAWEKIASDREAALKRGQDPIPGS